ncbi:hypothetical protein Pyn_17745 [Prunus yedoensis var. nudiflora]|uniref:Uncharacterized protein n=1 Tax=Prunus yedoensis var. nudiflora TaxID=2094558 RepID=A0A314Z2Z1_PRUYE|nr:hypothetical protein Pyn_17745 [Prunus yedoensis var. nudiflora]
MDVVFREHEIYFSDAHEDTSQISEFFPDSFQTQNNRSQASSDRSPDPNDRSLDAHARQQLCLKATGRMFTPTGRHARQLLYLKATGRLHPATGCPPNIFLKLFRFNHLPAIKLRRRKLRSLCLLRRILQLQYHTNHLLRTSFRHRAYISDSKTEESW